MTEQDVARVWHDLEGRLRPFVARRVSTPADVDDVLQDVFLRVSRGLAGLREDERLTSWLFAIARNAITDHHRRVARDPAPSAEVPEPVSDEAGDGDRLVASLTSCVAGFVAMLPEEQREAITLVELEGMSQKDAAAMLGITHSGMKSRVQRGRAALREMFDRACRLEMDGRNRVIECEPRACGGCEPRH